MKFLRFESRKNEMSVCVCEGPFFYKNIPKEVGGIWKATEHY